MRWQKKGGREERMWGRGYGQESDTGARTHEQLSFEDKVGVRMKGKNF